MAGEIDRAIVVTSTVNFPGGQTSTGFGGTLFVTDDNTLAAGGDDRLRVYTTLAGSNTGVAVTDDFPANSTGTKKSVYDAALAYFSQEPYPARPFTVARWNTAAGTPRIVGGILTAQNRLDAIAGSVATDQFKIGNINIPLTTVKGITSSTPNSAEIATALTTDINATSFAGVVVSGADNRITITQGTSGTLADITGPVAIILKLDTSQSLFDRGSTLETFTDFIREVQNHDHAGSNDFYWITLDNNITSQPTEVKQVTDWVIANSAERKHLLLDVSHAEYLSSTEATRAARLSTDTGGGITTTLNPEQIQRITVIYSGTKDYKSCSIAGRFSSVDFEGTNTLITANFKTLPGRTADRLTDAQIDYLRSDNINYYVPFGATNVVANGTTLRENVFIDTIYWIDWFTWRSRRGIDDLLVSSPRVPMDNAGRELITNTVRGVCEIGLTNGGISPGTVSAATVQQVHTVTGQNTFGGNLPRGYRVFVEHIGDTERSSRRLPDVHVWMNGSSAIHEIILDLRFD